MRCLVSEQVIARLTFCVDLNFYFPHFVVVFFFTEEQFCIPLTVLLSTHAMLVLYGLENNVQKKKKKKMVENCVCFDSSIQLKGIAIFYVP